MAALLDYDFEGAADDLEEIARPLYADVIRLSFSTAGDALGVGISFSESNPQILKVIDTLGKRVRNVTETTRDDIRRWVELGTQEGLSIKQIAEQLRSSAADISQTRAELIARSEMTSAFCQGNLLAYESSGVVDRVEWLNSNDACPICEELGGQVVKLGDLFNGEFDAPPAHPNCTCDIAPVVAD